MKYGYPLVRLGIASILAVFGVLGPIATSPVGADGPEVSFTYGAVPAWQTEPNKSGTSEGMVNQTALSLTHRGGEYPSGPGSSSTGTVNAGLTIGYGTVTEERFRFLATFTSGMGGGSVPPTFGPGKIGPYTAVQGRWASEGTGAILNLAGGVDRAEGVSYYIALPGGGAVTLFASANGPVAGTEEIHALVQTAQAFFETVRFQVKGQPTATPAPLAECTATMLMPQGLKPGDTLSPDVKVTSADGKPLEGLISAVWSIGGRQASSVTWDGKETRVTLQLSCQGRAQELSAVVPAYVKPNDSPGGDPGAPLPPVILPPGLGIPDIGGLLNQPPPGMGPAGAVPGPRTLREAMAGIFVPAIAGLIGTAISAITQGAGAMAGAVPGAPAGAATEPPPLEEPRDRKREKPEQKKKDDKDKKKPEREQKDDKDEKKDDKEKPEKKAEPPAKPDPAERARRGARVEAAKAAADKALAEAAKANSMGGLMWGTGMQYGKEFAQTSVSLVGAGKDVLGAAKDIAQHPLDSLAGALKATKEGVEGAGKRAGELSVPLEQGLRTALSHPLDTGKAAMSGLWNTVTDPHKLWEAVKTVSGYENFGNALDPNRTLVERLGQVGLGVANLYGALSAGEALKNGVTGLMERQAAGPAIPKVPFGAVSSEGLVAKGARTVVDAPVGVVADLRGIPKSQLQAIRDVARETGTEISIRPPNAAARGFLESGEAVPKPPTVHNTSLTKVDELIGGPANREGLVGAFKPTKVPDVQTWSGLSQEERLRVMQRFDQRTEEWEKLMASGRKDVVVRDGVLHDVRTGKPFVSDIDLGAITRNGVPVPEDEARMIYSRLAPRVPGVTHPPINEWYAVGAENKRTMSTTMGGHLAGEEAMITLDANGGTKATYFGGLVRP